MHALTARTGNEPVVDRLALTALVATAEAMHLAWEWMHGAIVSQRLLGDPTLPALWNGWGLLVLPAIAWIASARLVGPSDRGGRLHPPALRRAVGAMPAGIAMSVAFTSGRSDLAGYILGALAISGLALRVYRIEYLLGFVVGMAYTFGALIPTVIGGAIALASAAVWSGPWRLVAAIARRFRA